jgi:hypothetical protein
VVIRSGVTPVTVRAERKNTSAAVRILCAAQLYMYQIAGPSNGVVVEVSVVGVVVRGQCQDTAVLALRYPGWRDPVPVAAVADEGMAARPPPTRLTRQRTTTRVTMLCCMASSSTSPLHRLVSTPGARFHVASHVRSSEGSSLAGRRGAAPFELANVRSRP